MPRLRLTDLSISKLPQSTSRITYWDEGLPAFGVRVGARRKTFVVIVKPGHRIKLGNYPFTTLKDARREALRRLSDRSMQSTEVDAERSERVVENFIAIHHAKSRPRWRREQERLLTKPFLSKHNDVALNRSATKDILAILDGLKEIPSEQLHCYRALKTFFSWAQARKSIATSPLQGLKPPSTQADRDRVLSDKEIVAIYRAAQKMEYPFGDIVLIIFHTAMRRGEVGALKRSYVTEDRITLPADIRSEKKGGELVLPNLIGPALAEIPKSGDSDYFFPNEKGGPFISWSPPKVELDKLSGVSNWTLHDIRRTVRTKLSEWNCCDDATAERILGHVSSESKVSRIYNRWKHFPQKKAALEVYERRLSELLAGS